MKEVRIVAGEVDNLVELLKSLPSHKKTEVGIHTANINGFHIHLVEGSNKGGGLMRITKK